MKSKEAWKFRKRGLACLFLTVSLIVSLGFWIGQTGSTSEEITRENSLVGWGRRIVPVNFTRGSLGLNYSTAAIWNLTWSNFTFCWGPESQRIVDGVLWINVSLCFRTCKLINESDSSVLEVTHDLVVVVETNAKDYYEDDYMGFVFDTNRNGRIDVGDWAYIAFANNDTEKVSLCSDGFLAVAIGYYYAGSSYHRVTFDAAKGYNFVLYLDPLDGVQQCLKREGDNFLHICFASAHETGVFVDFPFSIPADALKDGW